MNTISLSEVKALLEEGHAITPYPRKGQVVIDGFKTRKASKAVLSYLRGFKIGQAKVKRRNPTFKTGKPKPGTRATRTPRGIVKQDVTPSYTIKQTGKHSGVISNPRGRQYKKAVSLYHDFTGKNPRHLEDWDVMVPDVAMEVGKVTGIMYKARVDGREQEFLHEFTGRSRPILAASSDGRQLLLLGGDYKMTERGIVDGTYEFVR